MESSLVSQCLAFCQTLASQGKAFNFKLTNTPFSFTQPFYPEEERKKERGVSKKKLNFVSPSPSKFEGQFFFGYCKLIFHGRSFAFLKGALVAPDAIFILCEIWRQRLWPTSVQGGGGRGRKRVAPPQSDGKNRLLLTRLVFCQIIHLFE